VRCCTALRRTRRAYKLNTRHSFAAGFVPPAAFYRTIPLPRVLRLHRALLLYRAASNSAAACGFRVALWDLRALRIVLVRGTWT